MRNNLHNAFSYKLIFGDLFESIKKAHTDILVPHLVSNSGRFSSGFSSAVEKNYPIVKANYELISVHKLGDNQIIKIDAGNRRNIIFVNMIAQNINVRKGKRQINYLSLVRCMAGISSYIKNNYSEIDSNKIEIHAPKFGCGIAGGNWNFISDLIDDVWEDFTTYVYSPKRD